MIEIGASSFGIFTRQYWKIFQNGNPEKVLRSVSIFKHMILVISDFQGKNLTF